MNQHFRISALLPVRLMDHQLSPSSVLQQAGLPSSFFKQERIYATTSELFALYRAIGELSSDPGIGLKLGAEARFERYHPPAVVAVCSRTFRDALERMGRYKQLTCPEDILVTISGEEATVEFVFREATEPEPEVLVDLCLSWIYGVGQRGTAGQIVPLRLELSCPIQRREMYEERFGCRVRFKAAHNALVFRNRDLDRPFVTHNQELLQIVGGQLDNELEEHHAATNLADQVKRTLKRSLAGRRPILQDVAQELGTSTRTLQRKLGDMNVTFKHLVEETRRELAQDYLRQSTMDLNGVAFLLGYEDSNSFFRAFQEWEGTTPGEWRTRHPAPASPAASR